MVCSDTLAALATSSRLTSWKSWLENNSSTAFSMRLSVSARMVLSAARRSSTVLGWWRRVVDEGMADECGEADIPVWKFILPNAAKMAPIDQICLPTDRRDAKIRWLTHASSH